jgi:hypothetical protein
VLRENRDDDSWISGPLALVDGGGIGGNQTEPMVPALKNRKVSVGYFLFGGKQHAFRTAENIKRALDGERHFYAAPLVRSGLRF